MLPALLLDPSRAHRVLDMCAAPGSKSVQLLAMMEADNEGGAGSDGGGGHGRDAPGARGLLVANDASLPRAISLTHRLTAVGVASPFCAVTSLDARWWPDTLLSGSGGGAGGGGSAGESNGTPLRFERVLCDVPCSGDGTLRKRHAHTPSWNADAAMDLHATQCRLLMQGLRQLATDGVLVYSTCSFNPVENEAVVAEALRATRRAGSAGGGMGAFVLDDPRETHPHLFRGHADGGDSEGDGGGLYAAPGLRSWGAPADGPQSMQPPSGEAERAWFDPLLARCVRLMPHRAPGPARRPAVARIVAT